MRHKSSSRPDAGFASPPGTLPPAAELRRHTQVIELALPGDRQDVIELFAEDLTDLRQEVDRPALGQVFDVLVRDARQVLLVARVAPGEAAVGVLVATRIPSVKFQGWSMWIEELYVARSARQWGLGRRLVEHLLELARQEGCRGIDLEAYHGNAPAALLYRALGFRRLGRERFAYRFAWEDEPEDEP